MKVGEELTRGALEGGCMLITCKLYIKHMIINANQGIKYSILMYVIIFLVFIYHSMKNSLQSQNALI